MLLMLILNHVIMTVIFVSSRIREREQEARTVQITVPSDLVMNLLAQGAILQVQIGPVPLRPILRPGNPEESTRPHPPATETSPRLGSRRPEAGPARPERPRSRCPPARPVTPFTDWTSLSNNEVISVDSDNGSDSGNDNYIPRSPVYEPDHDSESDPEEEARGKTPGQSVPDSEDDRPLNNLSNERPRSPLGRGSLLQRVSPFLRGVQRRRNLGKIRPM